MKCPKCSTEVKNENINVMTDVAQCQSCHHLFKISQHLETVANDAFDINNPPGGTWVRKEFDRIVIGASTRSPLAFFIVPFMIVWSGGSVGGIYGTQIATGHFNPILSLFGIPFILASIAFWSLALMLIWGKVELDMDRVGGKIFTGIGTFGFTKRFTWDEVSSVSEKQSSFRYPGSRGAGLQLEGKKRISFANMVNESRRYYLLQSLRGIIYKAKTNKNFL